MRTSLITSLLVAATAAFPAVVDQEKWNSDEMLHLMKRVIPTEEQAAEAQNLYKRSLDFHKDSIEARELRSRALSQDPLGISKAQTNCGPTPCLTFSEEDQLVSVTGQNAYASPAADEIRGPCPGLNAAANHGYLPRSGYATIEETVAGLTSAYNLGDVVTAALAAYAIAVDGNIVQGVWSIGGPLPADKLVGSLLGTGQGLSYSHNNYEGDASIGRNDAYINHGDAHSLNVAKFEAVYALGGKEDRYTLDKFRQRFESVQDASIATNPYYFTGAFSTVVVVPAAYNFVINLMSNHTKEEPSGYLDGYNFKSFFGITGKPGSFKWIRGQERIPKDWYRRPTSHQYEGNDVGEDVAIGYAAYPRTAKYGGNTGKVNTFTGVNLANATGGAYNAKTLLQGNNFSCFAFQLAQQGLPAFLKGAALLKANTFLDKYFSPITGPLSCPQIGKYDAGLFSKYPGRNYNPKGPATNYKE